MRLFPAYCVYHRSLWSVNVSFKARYAEHRMAGPLSTLLGNAAELALCLTHNGVNDSAF
jgi:hypothetical protein